MHLFTRAFWHGKIVLLSFRDLAMRASQHSCGLWCRLVLSITRTSMPCSTRAADVCPFALPISLRLNHGERTIIMPDRIGSAPLPTDLIVFTRYRPEAIWRPRRLAPAETMLQLIRHSIAIRRNPRLVLPVLKKISLQARSQSFLGRRGDPLQLLHWLTERSKT